MILFMDLFFLIIKLLKNEITPFFVFDGKPPKAKDGTINSRAKRKNDMKMKIEELKKGLDNIIIDKNDESKNNNDESKNNNDEFYDEEKEMYINEINRNERNMICVRKCDKILCIKLFDLIGIPYAIADGEAEILCARLCRENLAHGCFSQDSDLMPNGTINFLRDLSIYNNYVMEYHLPTILTLLKLELNEFIDLCILCGCDYVDRIKGIGPISAYKLIVKYKSIEEVIKHIRNNEKKNNKYGKFITDEYCEKYLIARDIFTKRMLDDEDVEKYKEIMKFGKTNFEELNIFLNEEIKMDIGKSKKLISLLGGKMKNKKKEKNKLK